MDTDPLVNFSQSSSSAKTAGETQTSFISEQGILPQTSTQIGFIHTSPSDQATSTSPIQDRGMTGSPPQPTRADSVQADLFQHLPPLEQAIQSPLPTFHLENKRVASGTLEGLVEFLIAGFNLPKHTYYRDTFIIACSELTTPEDLFQVLSHRLSEEEHTSDDGFAMQYNIFQVIIHWLKSNYFPPSEELLRRINVFCGDAIRRCHPLIEPLATGTSQLIDVKLAPSTTVRVPNPGEPLLKNSEIKPSDVAVALSLLEGDHFRALQPSDYLLYRTSDRVETYLKTNKKIKLWVIRTILHCDTVPSRSGSMKFFIYTALECYLMRNFSSAVAIATALHSSSVENLKVTTKAARDALPAKKKAEFSSLYEIINQSDHRNYLAAINSGGDTCIPWLPVHLKELSKVIRQPLTVHVDGQHLVNFNRYNRFMDDAQKILHYSPPDLEDKRHGGQLTYLLDQLHNIDPSGDLEQQLWEKSRRMQDSYVRDAGFKFPKHR